MNNQPNDLKCRALEAAVYSPQYKEEEPIDEIVFQEELDVEAVKEHMRGSVPLTSYNRDHYLQMVEILDVLHQYRNNFLVDHYRYITFYWSGVLVFRITVDKEVTHNKQMHISVQKYKSEYEKLEQERRYDEQAYWRNVYGLSAAVVLATGIVTASVLLVRNR